MKEGNLLTDMSGPEGKSDGRVDVYDFGFGWEEFGVKFWSSGKF